MRKNLGAFKKLFKKFDQVCEQLDVYKVHAIGEGYVVMGYTGKLDKEGVAVEILFEVLQNARMMQITDLEEEVKTHIISNLVGGSKITDAAQVFNILNLGLENKFPEVVEPCLAFCQTILSDERMISTIVFAWWMTLPSVSHCDASCDMSWWPLDAAKKARPKDACSNCNSLSGTCTIWPPMSEEPAPGKAI